jgi:hypothetical protein
VETALAHFRKKEDDSVPGSAEALVMLLAFTAGILQVWRRLPWNN